MNKSFVCFIALFFCLSVGLFAKSASRPNIVLFFVDDLGWADLGYRNPVFESPNIDALAEQGIDFQQAYIATPTCSPSRATLLTGKHPARLKMVRHIPGGHKFPEFDRYNRTDSPWSLWPKDPAQFPVPNWLSLGYTTYAEALGALGYYNQFIGKWHLGHEPYHPIHQGFDAQYGTSNFGHPSSYYPDYFKHAEVLDDENEKYLTDTLTDEAVHFIEGYDREAPFMLSFWYYNVHGPHEGREDLVEHFKAKGLEGSYAEYVAMLKSVDESIGRVREALDARGIADNTLLIFLSDQGGAFQNGAFHGGKKHDTLYEGGARVPFIVYWPGVTNGGINESLVQSTDLFPTLIEIAGGNAGDYGQLDGVSLLESIQKNEALEREEPIYGYRAYEDLYASVREGDWKLLAYRSGKIKLYNIAEDIGEQNDVSRTHPKVVEQLVKKFARWEVEMGVETYSGVQ